MTIQFLSVIIVTIFFIFILCTILSHLIKTKRRKNISNENYPFENTIKAMLYQNTILQYILQTQNELKDKESFIINLYGLPWLVATKSIENITHVLKDVDTFGKGPNWIQRFSGLLGQGIFNSDGEIWYKHRKLSANLFKLSCFKNEMIDTFHLHCIELIEVLKEIPANEKFDIQNYMFNFTLESIGRIGFGVKFDAIKQKKVWFAEYFDYCQAFTNESFFDPFWRLKRYFTPAGWLFYWRLFCIDRFAYNLVRKRRETIKALDKERKMKDKSDEEDSEFHSGYRDLLSLYIGKDGDGASDSELRDTILNFLIAGRDTTANALSWAIFTLCVHPEQQVKCYEEIHSVFEANRLNSSEKHVKLSYQDLASTKYLEAFCMEVLRLYPSVPKEGKFAFKDCVLPDGTEVKKGEMVVFSPWAMGRTESLWKNATEFRPERFLEDPRPSPFVFTAFQAGPRICLGQNMAMLEMKYVLAYLMENFEFKLEQPVESVTYHSTLTLPIKDGLLVSIKQR